MFQYLFHTTYMNFFVGLKTKTQLLYYLNHNELLSISKWYPSISHFFSTDKPGPPVDLEATKVDETFVELSYDEPDDDGGSQVTGYVIEKKNVTKR